MRILDALVNGPNSRLTWFLAAWFAVLLAFNASDGTGWLFWLGLPMLAGLLVIGWRERRRGD